MWGEGRVPRSQPMSTAVQRSLTKLWRFNSIFNLCIESASPLNFNNLVSPCMKVHEVFLRWPTTEYITLDWSALNFFKWTESRDVIFQKGLPGYPAYPWRRRVQGRRDPLCYRPGGPGQKSHAFRQGASQHQSFIPRHELTEEDRNVDVVITIAFSPADSCLNVLWWQRHWSLGSDFMVKMKHRDIEGKERYTEDFVKLIGLFTHYRYCFMKS